MSIIKKTILSVVGKRILSPAQVSNVTAPTEHFRFIELESEDLKQKTLRPGDKLQINTGNWNVRTYTPISLDADIGRVRVLAFIRENSPGSVWAKSAKLGQSCEVLGPRSSLDLSAITEPTLLFGDETCFGLASISKTHFNHGAAIRFVFEVNSTDESRVVLDKLSLGDSILISKNDDQSHLSEALQHILRFSLELKNSRVILAGRTKSIQALRNGLKELLQAGRVTTKVYWADGKTGID